MEKGLALFMDEAKFSKRELKWKEEAEHAHALRQTFFWQSHTVDFSHSGTQLKGEDYSFILPILYLYSCIYGLHVHEQSL